MKPEKGQYVKIIFRNSSLVEGIVEEWTEKESVLKSNNSYIIISNTTLDVMTIKIVLDHYQPEQLQKTFTETESKFQEVLQSPSNDDLRVKNLASLKSLLIEQEKKIVSEKLKEHNISGISKVKYGIPNI